MIKISSASERWFLMQLKKRDSGIKKTHSIVVRLIVLSIETGCVTGKDFIGLLEYESVTNGI